MYALDFLYFKCADIKRNETQVLRRTIANAADYIRAHAKADGSLAADPRQSPLEETRRLAFAVNLLEDIRQDAAVSFDMDPPLVAKIFETIPNADLTANYVRDALRGSARPVPLISARALPWRRWAGGRASASRVLGRRLGG